MANKNYEFFVKNMPTLFKQYGHQFLIIKDEKVIGARDTFEGALNQAIQTEKMGTFLIQECFEKKEEGIYYFQGNVSFSPVSA